MRHKPYEISIPTPSGRTQGTYVRGDERERCIVLVNAPAYADSPALTRALKGTVATTRRAGMSTLVLPYRTEMSRAVFDILGALRVLVAWGTTRVALLVPAEYRDSLLGDEALAVMLTQMRNDVNALEGGTAQVLADVQSLADMTPRLLETVVGLGAIAYRQCAGHTAIIEIECRLHPRTDTLAEHRWSLRREGSGVPQTQRAIRDVLIHWVTAAMYGIELSWNQMSAWLRDKARLSAGALPLPEMDPITARRVPSESARATFRLGLFWLDQQLERVVTHFGTRDLELARLARLRLDAAPVAMNPYRKAQMIWAGLDHDARREWLCSCASLGHAAGSGASPIAGAYRD